MHIAWSPTHADILVSVSEDKTIRLYDVISGESNHLTTTDANSLVVWKPDGLSFLVGDIRGKLTRFDLREGNSLQNITSTASYQHNSPIHDCKWLGNEGERIALAAEGVGMTLLTGNLQLASSPHSQVLSPAALALPAKNNDILFIGESTIVSLWQVSQMCCIETVPFTEDACLPHCLDVNDTGTILAFRNGPGKLALASISYDDAGDSRQGRGRGKGKANSPKPLGSWLRVNGELTAIAFTPACRGMVVAIAGKGERGGGELHILDCSVLLHSSSHSSD